MSKRSKTIVKSDSAAPTQDPSQDPAINQQDQGASEDLPETGAEQLQQEAGKEDLIKEETGNENADSQGDEAAKEGVQENAEAAPEAQQPVVVVQTQVPQKSRYEGHAQSLILEYFDRIRTEGTAAQKSALATMETFSEFIRPKVPVTTEDFVTQQRIVLRAMTNALAMENYDDFRQVWNIFQKFFQAHHDIGGVFGSNTPKEYTALSEYRICQPRPEAWKDRVEDYSLFKSLVAVLRACRNPDTVKAEVKMIGFDRLSDHRLMTEVAINNLKQFYNV